MGDIHILRPADLPPEDLERESLDASAPVCDHRSTRMTVIQICECGLVLHRDATS